MSQPEAMLWSRLKGKQLDGYKFRRQQSISNFIVDFCCPILKLIIEIDGDSHYQGEAKVKDAARDAKLEELGFKVLRYLNSDIVRNIDGVLEDIMVNTTPCPSSKRRGI